MSFSRRSFLATATALAVAPLVGCGRTTSAGSTPSPSTKRAVVLEFAAADTLAALGRADAVVGLTRKALPPALAKAYTSSSIVNVGGLKDVDIDKVASAQPDVICYGGRQEDKKSELAKIGAQLIDTQVDGSKGTIAHNRQIVTRLADLYGAGDAATKALATIDSKVAAVRAKASTAGPTLVLMVSGGKLSAFGAGSRFDLIFNELGLTPALKASGASGGRHGTPMSMEAVAQLDPTTILVLDRDRAIGQADAQPAAKVLDNTIIAATKAARQGRIGYLDGPSWYLVGGGLTTMGLMIDDIAKAVERA
ncbi:siderophore ABC transporter substrate-binding protein [Acidipropionibacterium timonense]|uniref:siderophore ABC transporter substrate-binding protein n=1 Tax=Acidipropionibacterium timonense TaxID=2161818 RepID=UPI001436BA2A|nr:ABC transporter substrate-binding protein [Acidipropionibacterium timonense]